MCALLGSGLQPGTEDWITPCADLPVDRRFTVHRRACVSVISKPPAAKGKVKRTRGRRTEKHLMCSPGRQVRDPQLGCSAGGSLINAGGSVRLLLKMGAGGWARDCLRQNFMAAELREEVVEVEAGQAGTGCSSTA